jgi:hypothetical protein
MEAGHFVGRTGWLGIVDKVKTKLLCLDEDIFIPELDISI